MLNINTKISIDAGSQTHVLFSMTSGDVANPISVPKLGTDCGNPKPKKLRPVSIPIFPAKFNVELTIINELKFGITSRNIILKSLVPNVSEAEHYLKQSATM